MEGNSRVDGKREADQFIVGTANGKRKRRRKSWSYGDFTFAVFHKRIVQPLLLYINIL